jgi:hypothetical protein
MSIKSVIQFFRARLLPRRVRRYEVLLPLKYNDGREVEPEKIDQTTREFSNRFGAVTQDLIRVSGIWRYGEEWYQDHLLRLRVDTGDPHARRFFRTMKESWKERFDQIDIWITAHRIEVI